MQELEFQLNSEYVELNQLLKMVGICDSGGAGKALVAEGVVSVDGQVWCRSMVKWSCAKPPKYAQVQW